jgi:ribosomal protein L7Ae-like RNA K-turn-binding protein
LKLNEVTSGAEELFDQMRQVTRRRVLEVIGLARRAAETALGIENVRRAMKEDRARFVCIAGDASESTRRQLIENIDRLGLPHLQNPASTPSGTELGRSVGLDFASAVAVTGEPFATKLAILSRSLEQC